MIFEGHEMSEKGVKDKILKNAAVRNILCRIWNAAVFLNMAFFFNMWPFFLKCSGVKLWDSQLYKSFFSVSL